MKPGLACDVAHGYAKGFQRGTGLTAWVQCGLRRLLQGRICCSMQVKWARSRCENSLTSSMPARVSPRRGPHLMRPVLLHSTGTKVKTMFNDSNKDTMHDAADVFDATPIGFCRKAAHDAPSASSTCRV